MERWAPCAIAEAWQLRLRHRVHAPPVTVTDLTAKCRRVWTRRLLMWKVELYAEEALRGDIKRLGADFAARATCEVLVVAAAHRLSAAVLFVDLAAAFDSAVRELLMAGRMAPQAVRSNLLRMGVDERIVEVLPCGRRRVAAGRRRRGHGRLGEGRSPEHMVSAKGLRTGGPYAVGHARRRSSWRHLVQLLLRCHA
jgi:hypothetical protein